MRTIGIDLSSQPLRTAAAIVEWDGAGGAAVVELRHPATDDELVELVRRHAPARTGIDSPFGWPVAFVDAVSRWDAAGAWPAGAQTQDLRMRSTDVFVHEQTGRWPLSVASDRIAMVAFRCARLLRRLAADGPVERVGGPFAEVYPAAARAIWRLPRDPREVLRVLELAVRADDRTRCLEVDHCLDAVLCALVARAVDVGKTLRRPEEIDRAVVDREGWIELPAPGSLDSLGRI